VFTSVRPESISEVDADTRDRWVVQAAEQTVSRVSRMASAKQADLAGDDLRLSLLDRGVDESAAAGVTLALDHYSTTGDYLDALRTTALDAARVVSGDTDEAEGLSLSPGDGTDDPIPLLASLGLDTDVSTPETTADEASTDATAGEPAAEPSMETASDDATAETTIDEEPAVSETPSGSEPETVESEPEPSTTASASEPEPSSGVESDLTDDTFGDGESGTDTAEPEATTSTAADTDTAEADEDLGEFDPEFELDEDEREEIEQEYGTDFQTGTEVNEPGEADMETPDPEDLAEAAEEGAPAAAADAEPAPESAGAPAGNESPEPGADAATSDAPAETPETATDAGADETTAGESPDEGTPAEDVALEDAVMEVMEDLDDGSGADREELLAAVVDRYGADPDAVDDAIQDALMGGRCYEPDDGKLTPI
jgi:hypothetical protein